jgi:proteasome lid subunit RPN8/RPN11
VRLSLPRDQADRLIRALGRARRKEIGGQLFGELIAPSYFRATEITVQALSGSIARFVVDVMQAVRDAARFYDRTRHCYTRFNYIGEWHSHPSFELRPSETDLATMQALVADPEFRGTFAVLMIVRLDGQALQGKSWVFDPAGRKDDVELEIET